MIDLHSHIISGVDDGSEDIEMSLEIAKLYVENGIDKVVCTPHYIEGAISYTPEKLKIKIEELKKELFQATIPLEIYPGNEIYINPSIVGKILEVQALTINNSRYTLIELPMNDMPIYVKDVIYELRLKGIRPIIAHPERNSRVVNDPNILYELINMGALVQLNLPSLGGMYGDRVRDTGMKLLQHNMVHFVGTDTHTNRRRSPKVGKFLDILSTIVTDKDFEALTIGNPQSVLDNKEIEIKPPIKIKKKDIKLSSLIGLFTAFQQ